MCASGEGGDLPFKGSSSGAGNRLMCLKDFFLSPCLGGLGSEMCGRCQIGSSRWAPLFIYRLHQLYKLSDTIPCVYVPFRTGFKPLGERLVHVVLGRDCLCVCMPVHIDKIMAINATLAPWGAYSNLGWDQRCLPQHPLHSCQVLVAGNLTGWLCILNVQVQNVQTLGLSIIPLLPVTIKSKHLCSTRS